jgi:hypothetical protein
MKGPRSQDHGLSYGDDPRPDHPADVFQWVLNLDLCGKAFGRLVSAPYLHQAFIDLRTASETGHAHEVRLAWQLFLDVAGPQLTGMFIREGGWGGVCEAPLAEDNTPSQFVVWKGDGERVLGRLQYKNDQAVDISFVVE